MRLRDEWRAAFPMEEASTVIRHMVETWYWAAKFRTQYFHFGLHEPAITKALEYHLRTRSTEVGLNGLWGPENQENDYDPETGKPLKSWRTDILYFSNRHAKPLKLTFEFKKLKDTSGSRKAYYGEDGMLRFVDNKYSREQPMGIMVGIMDKPKSPCPKKLKQALTKADIASALKIIPDADEKLVREPSVEFKGFAAFDTHHSRVSGEYITIVLAHLMLPFPV